MRYSLWRLLRRCFWIKLDSHWRGIDGTLYFGEWEQKRSDIRNKRMYQFIKDNTWQRI